MWKLTAAMVAIGSSASADGALSKCSIWGDVAEWVHTEQQSGASPTQIIGNAPEHLGPEETHALVLGNFEWVEALGGDKTALEFRTVVELSCLDAPDEFTVRQQN